MLTASATTVRPSAIQKYIGDPGANCMYQRESSERSGTLYPTARFTSSELIASSRSISAKAKVESAKYAPLSRYRRVRNPTSRPNSAAATAPATMPIQGETPASTSSHTLT